MDWLVRGDTDPADKINSFLQVGMNPGDSLERLIKMREHP